MHAISVPNPLRGIMYQASDIQVSVYYNAMMMRDEIEIRLGSDYTRTALDISNYAEHPSSQYNILFKVVSQAVSFFVSKGLLPYSDAEATANLALTKLMKAYQGSEPIVFGKSAIFGGEITTGAMAPDLSTIIPYREPVAQKAKKLPGMEFRTECPGEFLGNPCVYKDRLYHMVQHLNDEHRWTRESIADFLDELHDSGQVNLEFQPWDEEPPEAPKTIEAVDKYAKGGYTGTEKYDASFFEGLGASLSQPPEAVKDMLNKINNAYGPTSKENENDPDTGKD